MLDTQQVRIQVIFRRETSYAIYQDALWFTQEEYAATTQEDIDKMKQERVDKWLEIMANPPPELTKEEKLAQIQSEIDGWTLRIQKLQAEKDKLNG